MVTFSLAPAGVTDYDRVLQCTDPVQMSEAFGRAERLIVMEMTEAHRLPRVVMNERRRRAVKLRLSGATKDVAYTA